MIYNFLFAIQGFDGKTYYLPDEVLFYMILGIGILLLVTLILILSFIISYSRGKKREERVPAEEKPQTVLYKVIIGCKDESVLQSVFIRFSQGDSVAGEGVKPCNGTCVEFELLPDTYTVDLVNVPEGFTYQPATVTGDNRVATIELVAVEPVAPEPVAAPEVSIAVAENREVIRYDRSFQARLIQSDDEVKKWYSELKNDLLSYASVRVRMSWKRESFRVGREPVLLMSFRGKTLCVFLPLAPQDFADSKYKIEDASNTAFAESTPCMYRIKNERRVKYAKELVKLVMERYGGERIERKEENYYMPYAKTEKLIKKGLIKQKASSEVAEGFIRRQSGEEE